LIRLLIHEELRRKTGGFFKENQRKNGSVVRATQCWEHWRGICIEPLHRMEFFLVNAMIAIAHHKQQFNHRSWAFKTDDFLEPLAHFPEIIMSERYKRRAYLSGILAKNEINRQDIYNKKLFLRVMHGHYILNPDLLLKLGDEWVNIYKLLDLELIKEAAISSGKMVAV
jgi:hypothetical protein